MNASNLKTMSGTFTGALKSKLGLKGKTKPGEMIAKMNAIKNTPKLSKKMGKSPMKKYGKK